MTRREELVYLAERCESMEGEDRGLDTEIFDALNGGTRAGRFLLPWAHRYTSSVDAAMTLIPKPWILETLSDHGTGKWGACLNIPMKWDCGAFAPTAARALTSACLRALSTEEPKPCS